MILANREYNILSIDTNRSRESSAPELEKEKLVHSNFRLRKNALAALGRLARQRKLSTNALLNHILDNYLAADVHFEQLGFALVGMEFLRRAFSKIREEKDIEESGRIWV